MVLYESDRTDRENQEVAATGISLAAKDPCLSRGDSAGRVFPIQVILEANSATQRRCALLNREPT